MPAEEDHQALGDGPGPAEREAAGVGLDPGLRDVGDDVALGLRGIAPSENTGMASGPVSIAS